jgi:hypothetical protein
MYVNGEKNGDVWTFIVANYKKNGRCPYVNPDRNPHLVSGNPKDIPKRTCEQVSAFVGYDDDICRVLEEDSLYEVEFNQRTYEPAKRTLLGHLSDFG